MEGQAGGGGLAIEERGYGRPRWGWEQVLGRLVVAMYDGACLSRGLVLVAVVLSRDAVHAE